MLKQLSDTSRPLLYLAFVYLLGISVGSLQTWIVTRWPPLVVGLCGSLIVLFLAVLLHRMVRLANWITAAGWAQVADPTIKADPPAHKGLIVTASPGAGISSAEAAIRYHHGKGKLERCWIITGGENSEAPAKSLVTKLTEEGISRSIFQDFVRLDPEQADNPDEVYKQVDKILRSLPEGWSESDVIADYTGGTKSITAGMVLACASPDRRLQFMKPNRYREDGTADHPAGSRPYLVDIRYSVRPKRASLKSRAGAAGA